MLKRPWQRRTALSCGGREKPLGSFSQVEGTKCEVRSRVSRFLAWGLGWKAACFLFLQGSGSGTGEGRERGGDVGGPEARPGKGVRSWEPLVRVGLIGSLVLRPKPSPIGLAYFFPEGADRAGTQGFFPREWGA